MRRAALSLILILFLSACAGPKQGLSLSKEPKYYEQDRSHPTANSLYFFLSGAYLFYEGDYYGADQVVNMALLQDTNSPQIRKLLYQSAMLRYLTIKDEASKARAEEILDYTRQTEPFDAYMLELAYSVYSGLGDIENRNWALDRLIKESPGLKAYIWEYARLEEEGKKPDTKLLDKMLKEADNPRLINWIALEYQKQSPQKAINILKEKGNSPESDQLLLRLYLQHKKFKELKQHFFDYSLPKDLNLAANYLLLLDSLGQEELIFSLSESILATKEIELYKILSFIAYMRENYPLQKRLYLQTKAINPHPSEIGKLSAVVLFHALLEIDKSLYPLLLEDIYSITNLSEALYMAFLHPHYQREAQRQGMEPKELIEESFEQLPPSLIKLYLKGISNKDDLFDILPALNLAHSLIDKGFGEKEDFDLILEHYMAEMDTDNSIRYLRKAFAKFPEDNMTKNNLGYLLLENTDELEEAERLILSAYNSDPDQDSFIDSAAWLFYKKGDFEQALKTIELIDWKETEPSAELHYHFGMVYLANGHKDEAIQHFKLATTDEKDKIHSHLARLQLDILK